MTTGRGWRSTPRFRATTSRSRTRRPVTRHYLQIYNPHTVAVTARVTYVRHTGAGVRSRGSPQSVPSQRIGLHVQRGMPSSAPNVPTSAVVQQPRRGLPTGGGAGQLLGWQLGGRRSHRRGVARAAVALCRGSHGPCRSGFQEYFTIFNPTSEPLDRPYGILRRKRRARALQGPHRPRRPRAGRRCLSMQTWRGANTVLRSSPLDGTRGNRATSSWNA